MAVSWRRVLGFTAASSLTAVGGICYAAYSQRPQFHKTLRPSRHPSPTATDPTSHSKPTAEKKRDAQQLPESWGESTLEHIAQDFFLGLSQLVVLPLLSWLNNVEIRDVHRFREAWAQRDERPLLTVCNHHSCLDEILVPRLLSDRGFMPNGSSAMRWTLCRHDVCFKSEIMASYFGAQKALPVMRGAGLEQPSVALMAKKLVRGGWVHLYPEGRIWQCSPVGGAAVRPDGSVYIAPSWQQPYRPYLRWGVGRIIAEAPISPRIVAYYHTGMADLQPQGSHDERLLSWRPRTGNDIVIQVGEPFDVDDLLQAHEEKVARLRARGTDDATLWHVRHALYSDITRRIHDELLSLERRLRDDLGLRDRTEQQRGKRIERPRHGVVVPSGSSSSDKSR